MKDIDPAFHEEFNGDQIEEQDQDLEDDERPIAKAFHNKRSVQNFHNSIFYKTALKEQYKYLKGYRMNNIDALRIQWLIPKEALMMFPG